MNKEDLKAALDNEINTVEKQYGSECKLKLIAIISLVRQLYPEQPEKKINLIPLSKWNEYHDYPTVGSLYQLHNRNSVTGFDYCIVKQGNRILIDEDKYFEWVQRNRGVKQ